MENPMIGGSDVNSTFSPYSSTYLEPLALELIKFSKNAATDLGGFGYLDASGKVDPSKPRQVYVQCRMIQVLGLAELFHLSESRSLIEDGVEALLDLFQDKVNGGFFNSIAEDGSHLSTEKLAYDHAFVLLAACTAKALGIARAEELLSNIDSVIDKFFWDEEFRMIRNSWDNTFTSLNDYRGINANMHAVEAFAAAYDVTGEVKYLDRAYDICERAINGFARENEWFLPEHFDSKWRVDKDFNINIPADPFCPFGITIGHLLEWSRLILHLKLQVADTEKNTNWIDDAARNLYDVAKKFGWAPDGGEGFVYTIDWQGEPVVTSRMHWVIAEAVMTSYVLWKDTAEEKYKKDYESWWGYIDAHVLDKINGSWHHELNAQQEVGEGTWAGKPDTYHAFNACVLPLYPLNTSFIETAKVFNDTFK